MKHFASMSMAAIAALLLCASISNAQTFSIVNISEPKGKDGLYSAKITIRNTASTNKTLKVVSHLEGKQEDHITYFCTGSLCYSPAVTEATHPMQAGMSDSVISYLEPMGINGTSVIRYVFSDAENPDDKIEQTFTFVIGPTSVLDFKNSVFVMSSPTPNPAVETATIQYSMPAMSRGSIEISSVDSKLLKTFELDGTTGSLVIPTAEFASGIYFYTLVVDGKKVATNRLVVAH